MLQAQDQTERISIHALREEGDSRQRSPSPSSSSFLSTPSARRATGIFPPAHSLSGNFYPRPPRGGRRAVASSTPPPTNFYPRPPRGGRRSSRAMRPPPSKFLSTPSARRATHRQKVRAPCKQFLSTPSARRATINHPPGNGQPRNFYPRPPRGGRPGSSPVRLRQSYFYPRPPRGGRRKSAPHGSLPTRFLSTPSARRATLCGRSGCWP